MNPEKELLWDLWVNPKLKEHLGNFRRSSGAASDHHDKASREDRPQRNN